MWQDSVIAACQVGAIASLQPILWGNDKPPRTTSFTNFVLASIVSASLATLHLWFSTVTAALIGISWLVIGLQKHKQVKQKTPERE